MEAQIYINWTYFEQIMVKSTQFEQNLVFLYKIGLLMAGTEMETK